MEQIFKLKLSDQLKKAVRGEISIHIINDKLVVDIDKGYLAYRYTVNNISTHIVQGLTTKILATRITEGYRKWILSNYFY